jgi:predicted nucleic acid-binding protein
MYDALLGDSCVDFAPEPLEVEKHWRPLTQLPSHSPKVWADAYLAAFAMTLDIEMLMSDEGFTRYKDL